MPELVLPGTAIAVSGMAKSFEGVPALRGVSIDIRHGRVHALLGGNGSGKSTFIKALAGVQPADAGEVAVAGQRVDARSMTPGEAARLGLRFVHQDLGLVDDLTVAENMALVRGFPGSSVRIDWRCLLRDVEALLARFELDISPRTKVADLRPAARTMVAIARAMSDSDKGLTLVLDEPTASLPDHEVEFLLDAVRRRAQRGAAVVYVSHRLSEVMAIADDVTVLRDGRLAVSTSRAELSEHQIVEHIAGRAIDRLYPERPASAPTDLPPALEVDGLSAGPLQSISLDVAAGEVVGVAGLLGSGRTSLLRAIFGDLPIRSGRIAVAGASGPFDSVGAAMAAGVGYVPEDRARDAAMPAMSIRENLSVSVLGRYFKALWFRHREERVEARQLSTEFLVRSAGVEQPLSSLSGGNQQKVVVARWLRRTPKLLMLDEPTQGVDVGARAEIYDLVRRASGRGAGVLVSSSDHEELAHLCDRVLVLHRGRLLHTVTGSELTAERLVTLSYLSEPSLPGAPA